MISWLRNMEEFEAKFYLYQYISYVFAVMTAVNGAAIVLDYSLHRVDFVLFVEIGRMLATAGTLFMSNQMRTLASWELDAPRRKAMEEMAEKMREQQETDMHGQDAIRNTLRSVLAKARNRPPEENCEGM